MPPDDSRVKRAGDYILGLMNEAERERAERDLEVDAAFRDTVMQMAERMHVFEHSAPASETSSERWKRIAAHIAELPQMRQADAGDALSGKTAVAASPRPAGMRLQALPSRRALAIVLGLIVAFALGYLTGKS